MPKVAGNCEGNFQRYYYDQLTNECKLFVYGGCRGNKNNYRSQTQCEQECLQGIMVADIRIDFKGFTNYTHLVAWTY